MKRTTLRVLVPAIILIAVSIGFIASVGIGTLSAFGWEDISLICPLGSLTTMLASKTLIPKALISLAIAIIAIILLGRAFCAWVCPVPLVSRLRNAFSKRGGHSEKHHDAGTEEKAHATACTPCDTQKKLDTRYFVLGGSLLSAAIFGFPVFCLICPIGLTFATVLLVFLLFTQGDVTWTVVIVPVLLVVEVVLFRKWCSKICPLAALMNLVGKLNRTWRPTINQSACLEAKGLHCKKCARACIEQIDLVDAAQGAPLGNCTKCGACADVCPAHAISLPLLPKNGADAQPFKNDENETHTV